MHSSDDEKEIADTEVSDQDVWDQLLLKQSASEVDKEEVKHVAVYIDMFLSFFQLCYRVSEQGISLLLAFLRALLLWISSVWPNSLHVSALRDILPETIFYLRKLFGRKSKLQTFVVCPNCNLLYNFSDCFVTGQSGMTESLVCSFFQYPSHPPLQGLTKCKTVLLKLTKA